MSFFSSIFHGIHTALTFVETKILPDVKTAEPTIEALSALIPGVGNAVVAIEQVAFGLLDQAAVAITATDKASVTNGVNISLDATAVAAIQALIAQFPNLESILKQAGSSTATPKAS